MEKLIDGFIKLITVLIDKFAHKRNVKNIQSIVHIYSALKELLYEGYGTGRNTQYPVHQFLILKACNGGGVIKPGSLLYLSCLYEDYRQPVSSAMRYQRVHLDGDYMELILNSMQKKSVHYKTDELREHSLLSLMNKTEGVHYSEMHYLYDRKGVVYFCTISTINDNETFSDPTLRLGIELAINKIKTEIRKAV